MSGFVKRTKAVDTANPAGGIDPAKAPNVGQYGWTSYDAGNVNQIIEYVDMCRKYAEQISDSVEYVKGKILILEQFMRYIENVYEDLKPVHEDITLIYSDVKIRHEDIILRHKDITSQHAEINAWNVETSANAVKAKASAAAAKVSETNADVSETGAKGWYDKSYELYDELRKGNVYRGTWNPHTNSYPAHGDTNSTWDVILNEGELEYVWNGTRWFWGDRLVYVKTTNTYQQIESGTTVNSVNGKKGAVVLNADDVKAVPVTRTVNGKTLSADISITSSDTNSVPTTRRVNNKTLDGDIVLTPADVRAVPLDRKVNNKFLNTDITLTPADVGAMPVVGSVDFNWSGHSSILPSHFNHHTYSDSDRSVYVHAYSGAVGGYDSKYQLRTNNVNGSYDVHVFNKGGLSFNGRRYYHEGFKPTAADVGALPITGGTIDGGITVRDGMTITGIGKVLETIGGYLRSDRDDVMSLDGKQHSFVTALKDAHLCGNTYADGRAWLKYDNSKPSAYAVCGVNGEFSIYTSAAGNSDPRQLKVLNTTNEGNLNTAGTISEKGVRVYSPNNKPTAAEVGALPITGGTLSGKLVVQSTGSAIELDAPSGNAMYILSKVGGENNWYIGKGSTNSDVVAFNSYKLNTNIILHSDKVAVNKDLYVGDGKVYHQGFKPTAADVGALKQGDFGIGASAAQGQIRSWVLPQFNFGENSIADEYLVLFPSAVAGPHAIKGEIHGSRGSSGTGNVTSIQRINAQSAYNQNYLFSSYESSHRFHYFSIIAIDGMNYVALRGDYTGGYAHNQLVFYGNVIGGDSRLFTRVRASDANVTVVTDNIQPTAVSYHTGNVVGSGGIIERGSNANGEYVKFADGTMICTAGSLNVSRVFNGPVGTALFQCLEVEQPFPVTFIANPTCMWSCEYLSGNMRPIVIHVSSSTTIARCVAQLGAALTITASYYVQAIGRWK